MAEFSSLTLAIEHATRQRDAQLAAVARVRRTLAAAKSQLDQLQGYAAETDSRWLSAQLQAVSGELVRHHYQFTERLQQAVDMQAGVMAGIERQLVQAEHLSVQAEYRLRGLQQLLERKQRESMRREANRTQRQMDEFAAQQYIRRQMSVAEGEML